MKQVLSTLVTLFLVAAASSKMVDAWTATPIVNTTVGPLYGFMNQFDTFSFRGIPYAKPPVGDLRFANPEDVDAWTSPLNVSEFGAGCYQNCHVAGKFSPLMCAPTMSEDCLYLNIYTPTLNTSANLPVVLFIHGGMFSWGAGSIPLYDGSLWAKNENIILVTINYRLNIFGGLYTGDDAVTGNFQILDQRQALKWTAENIKAFGGDPTRVTVSGQSAGATSTGIHYMSPGSWKYFSRAAVISDPYGLIPLTKTMAAELGTVVVAKLGCDLGNGSAATQLACLRNKTTEEIFKMSKTEFLPTPNEALAMFMQWQPFVDGEVIPMQPLDAMQQGKVNPVPLYIGTVANETIPFLDGLGNTDKFEFDVALDLIFGAKRAKKIVELFSPIPKKYAGKHYWLEFSKIFTDYVFYCPTMESARWASKVNGNRTYTYFFDEHPSWAAWYAGGKKTAPCAEYICHAFDLPSIFNSYYEIPKELNFPKPTEAEEKMSAWIQNNWGQFAHTGTIQGWPTYEKGQLLTYNISLGVPQTKILDNFRGKYCDYFDSIGYNRY